ncbi:MAG: putative porin [Candidatus Marinimicrobia bacterium]|nr:putative porin [Candidatus Neomarinimicrobiota bacterium]
MKKRTIWLSVVLMLVGILPSGIVAGELDLLVNELVEKGVISPGRAQEILILSEEEMRTQLAKAEVSTLPKWIQTFNLKGDFRLRDQWEQREGGDARNRARYRFRLGGEAEVVSGLNVGFGLASGGADPRSTNQTFENSFETKTIMLDYAYARYSAANWLTFTGGKIGAGSVFWMPSDYLWDTDITVEGLAAGLKMKNLFLNAGYYFVDEIKDDKDPAMILIQPGINMVKEGAFSSNLGMTYYQFGHVKDATLDHAKWSNTYYKDASNVKHLSGDYRVVSMGGDLQVYNVILPAIGMFCEYNRNIAADSLQSGFTVGFFGGYDKIKNKNQWQIKYSYRNIEKDSWLDIFPDSDAYGGMTGIGGSEIVFQYGLMKNVILGVDYYRIGNLAGTRIPEQIVQVDFQFKF